MKKAFVWLLLLALCFAVLAVPALAWNINLDDAVYWLNQQSGAAYNLDGKYGTQCSDFVSAYMNWLVTGDPYSGTYGVYNANYYPTVASWNPELWEVIANSRDLVPQPGDIFVSAGLASYGHTGVVISSDDVHATVVDQNGVNPSENYGSPAAIHYITWTGAYSPTYFIRYKGFAAVTPPPSPASGAVDWLCAQDGAAYDLDGKYGTQCSDFVSAYMNWLVTGDPWSGTYGVYNANYYPTVASWNPELWEVIANYREFVPQPGDIFVSAGLASYGHTGVVISSDDVHATVIDQNGVNPSENYGSPAAIHTITWTGAYSPTYFIRFRGTPPPIDPYPTDVKVTTDKASYKPDETVVISVSASGMNWFTIRIELDGQEVYSNHDQNTSAIKFSPGTPGTYQVTVSACSDWEHYTDASCSFFVEKPYAITLDRTELFLFEGRSATLTATISNTDACALWSSSDPSVASVDEEGNVKALKSGTAVITATIKGTDVQAVCNVIVSKGIVMRIAPKDPTWTEAGNIGYWKNISTGSLYRDKDCTEEISEDETIIPPLGDVSGDGRVNTEDTALLFAGASGAPVSFAETAKPDVSGDGKVNNRDAILLFRLIRS